MSLLKPPRPLVVPACPIAHSLAARTHSPVVNFPLLETMVPLSLSLSRPALPVPPLIRALSQFQWVLRELQSRFPDRHYQLHLSCHRPKALLLQLVSRLQCQPAPLALLSFLHPQALWDNLQKHGWLTPQQLSSHLARSRKESLTQLEQDPHLSLHLFNGAVSSLNVRLRSRQHLPKGCRGEMLNETCNGL